MRRERMSKIAPENMTDSQRKAAASSPRGRAAAYAALSTCCCAVPELMSPLQKVGEYLRFRCQLDRRIAEFATLIAARHWTQPHRVERASSACVESGSQA